jgi:signal transduction histidine kinase
MTNIARHARATRVYVTMMRDARGLVLNVSDNGCGFDPAAAGTRDSYGLLGMSERARLIGASLQIDSEPGSGTVVSICIPVENGREDDQDSDRG